MIKATISALFYGRPDVNAKFINMLQKTIRDRNDVEILILNNGCIDGQVSTDLVLNSRLKNVTYVPLGVNLGFGAGHNFLLTQAKGEFFVILNNDLFFQENAWLDKLIMPFGDVPNLKLVGLEGAPWTLSSNTTGYVSGVKGKYFDYLEGSCLAARTEDLRKYGLFDPIYEKGLFEDGDLSLRLKQMGFELSVLKIAHKHLRGQSLNQIDPAIRKNLGNTNCAIFKKRWSGYMQNRSFNNRILIKMQSAGIGDILCMTPVVEAVRKTHPTAIIEVTTTAPEVFMGNPHLSELYEWKREYKNTYDRVIDIRPNYGSYDLIAKDIERIAAVKLDSYVPQIYLSRLEVEEAAHYIDKLRGEEGRTVVGVHLQNNRPTWHGKCYPKEHAAILIQMIQETGAVVIEFGKDIEPTGVADIDLVDQTDLRTFFALMANLDCFVGIDSLGFHVAQAFGIPSFILFGATHPLAYIVDMRHVYPIMKEGLACVGCYQRKGKPDFNQCAINTQECMRDLTPEEVMKYILSDPVDLLQRNMKLIQDFMRKGPQ